jgi:hypothetical protein
MFIPLKMVCIGIDPYPYMNEKKPWLAGTSLTSMTFPETAM